MKERTQKRTMIRVEMHVPGEGGTAFEFEHCPMPDFIHRVDGPCMFIGRKCNYGLTEIELPEHCPMKLMMTSQITLRFSRIRQNEIGDKYDDSEEIYAERRAEQSRRQSFEEMFTAMIPTARAELKRWKSILTSMRRAKRTRCGEDLI